MRGEQLRGDISGPPFCINSRKGYGYALHTHFDQWWSTFPYTFIYESLYFVFAPQRKEYNVSRVPEEIGETQTMSEFEHAVVPVATHATHHEIAPAHIGNIKQDPTRPRGPQVGGKFTSDCSKGMYPCIGICVCRGLVPMYAQQTRSRGIVYVCLFCALCNSTHVHVHVWYMCGYTSRGCLSIHSSW